MRHFAYDILNKPDDKTFVWVDAVRDFDNAKARVKELEKTLGGEYVVFNEHALQTVCINKSGEKTN